MGENYAPTIKLHCWITKAKIIHKSIYYYFNKYCFNFTSITITVHILYSGSEPVSSHHIDIEPTCQRVFYVFK